MTLRSQNGLSANDRSKIGSYLIPGTTTRISVRKGNVATILCYFAAEFDKRVEDIDTPATRGFVPDRPAGRSTEPSRVFDDWGFAFRNVRGSSTVLSNHSSGSAIDLNATQHPRGVAGTFTAAQVREIRKILAECGDALRWGGEYRHAPVDSMHVEVNANAARVAWVAGRLRLVLRARARAAAKAKAAEELAAKHRKASVLARARAKAAAALATKKRKAAASAAAAALAAAAAAGGAVVSQPGTAPLATPTTVPSARATSTPGRTPRAVQPTPKASATQPPVIKRPVARPVLGRVLSYDRGKKVLTGVDVRRVQILAGVRGKAADSHYGPRTAAAVKRWQKIHGLKADGVFGRKSALAAKWRWSA